MNEKSEELPKYTLWKCRNDCSIVYKFYMMVDCRGETNPRTSRCVATNLDDLAECKSKCEEYFSREHKD